MIDTDPDAGPDSSAPNSGSAAKNNPKTGQNTLGIAAAGVFADHPPRLLLPAKVAPTLENESNLLRDPLITVACAYMPDYLFDFDRSFIKPDVHTRRFIDALAEVRGRHPNSPLSVFGHADPTGDDDYNAHLGGRRAAAFYGLVTRNVELWDDIYQNAGQLTQPCASDQWGARSFQIMLGVIPGADGNPYYSGGLDDTWNPALNAALAQFSKDKGVAAGPARRKAIYKLYMDIICTDKQNQPLQLDPTEFLAQGGGEKARAIFRAAASPIPNWFSRKTRTRFTKKTRTSTPGSFGIRTISPTAA